MKRIYSLLHQYISYVLLISFFLQSCGGGFDNNPLIPIQKEPTTSIQTNTHVFISPTNIQPLIDKQLTAQGGHRVTFYEEAGQLKADVEMNAPQGFSKTYEHLNVAIEQGAELSDLTRLGEKAQQRRIHIQLAQGNQPAKVVIHKKAGLVGGMKEGEEVESELEVKDKNRRKEKHETKEKSKKESKKKYKARELLSKRGDGEGEDSSTDSENEEDQLLRKYVQVPIIKHPLKANHTYVYNFTESNDFTFSNTVTSNNYDTLPGQLKQDADYIWEKISNSEITILCVALKDNEDVIKKFTFTNQPLFDLHNGIPETISKIYKRAHQRGYHLIVAQQSHAEGELMQFLQNNLHYTHIVAMGCDKQHCPLCVDMMNKFFGYDWKKITFSKQNGPISSNWYIPPALGYFLGNNKCLPSIVVDNLKLWLSLNLEDYDDQRFPYSWDSKMKEIKSRLKLIRDRNKRREINDQLEKYIK